MPEFTMIANEIAKLGRIMYKRGLIAGTDGNISARLDNDRVMITPSGKSKGRLDPEDMVVLDNSGRPVSGKQRASSESPLHLHLYRRRPDISACVHAHPPYATAFAVAGVPLTEKILPEVLLFVGNIALTEYAPPGTPRLAQSLDPFITDHNAFLMKNHGLITVGDNLDQAYHRLETVEHYARILFLAKQLGSVNNLDQDEINRLDNIRQGLTGGNSRPGLKGNADRQKVDHD